MVVVFALIQAEIVTVGREVLRGFTINTNASWLAQRLISLGFDVRRVTVVDDTMEDIGSVTREVLARGPSVAIYTGGLGPTFDDMTVEAVARALGLELRLDERALGMVKRVYEGMGLPLTEERVKMARLPVGSEPLRNNVGTAPGVWLPHGGTVFVLLPGVPGEMMDIFVNEVEPRLKSMEGRGFYVEAFLLSQGLPESTVARIVKTVGREVPEVYIKSHPLGVGEWGARVRLQVSYFGESRAEGEEAVRRAVSMLRERLAEEGARVSEE